LKKLFTILFLLIAIGVQAQKAPEALVTAIKDFHQALVNKNIVSVNRCTDTVLSYGHSNGWVETRAELIKNLETGYTRYLGIKEDSLAVVINGKTAHARFVGDYTVSLNGGTMNTYHLKVLEVWVLKKKRWVLFARQAVR
jgi:hypothetical protein